MYSGRPGLHEWFKALLLPCAMRACYLLLVDGVPRAVWRRTMWYVPRTTSHLSDADVDRSHYQMICQVFNWFVWYCGVRTYSNSMEATLTVAAIALWPFNDAPRFLRGKWIRFAAFD